MYMTRTSLSESPTSYISVLCPALIAPMAFPASVTSFSEIHMPSVRWIFLSGVLMPGSGISPDLSPSATHDTTPVPVMPLAFISRTFTVSPVEGLTLLVTTGTSLSSRTTLFHVPSSLMSTSDMDPGDASTPCSMDCPSMAGPAAAEPE